jgi:hypothetical protein
MNLYFAKQHTKTAGNNWVMILLLLLLAYSCANPVAPTGGPRDEDPPKVLRSIPENYSTNFKGGEVRVFFDEFIQLNNLNRKFLSSPPLQEMPDIRLRGRSIVMNIDEPLRANTTYNFFFADAIRDITEGNALQNFQFVVSTGDFVDSLSIRGYVTIAQTLEPAEGVFVMLYDEYHDSIPYKERPVYVSMTDKQGNFRINNMRDGLYKIFALEDINSNFIFDLPNERIAFLDSLIRPTYLGQQRPVAAVDTLDIDPFAETENNQQTEPLAEEVKQSENFYSMLLFQERDTLQRVVSSSLVRKGLMQIVFRVPNDSAWVRSLSAPFDDWYFPEQSKQGDTLKLWLRDFERDSVFIEVGDRYRVLDTLRISATPRVSRVRNDLEPQGLTLTANASRSQKLDYFNPLRITAGNPVMVIDVSLIRIIDADSIDVATGFEFFDQARRKIETTTYFLQGQNYQLIAYPGAFTDIFGLQNDTLRVRFATTSPEDYGNINLSLELPHRNNQFVLQVMDKDAKGVIQENLIVNSGVYSFRNLPAGNYRMRLIDDKNQNGRWDTGNYLKGRQPERIYYYQDIINLRANWDMDLMWELR